MNQSQQNLIRLAFACRNDKKQFKACCVTAQKLAMPKSALKAPQPSAATSRLQNFIRGIPAQDLRQAISHYGTTSVFNRINSQSILETAAQKFTEQAMKKAGGK